MPVTKFSLSEVTPRDIFLSHLRQQFCLLYGLTWSLTILLSHNVLQTSSKNTCSSTLLHWGMPSSMGPVLMQWAWYQLLVSLRDRVKNILPGNTHTTLLYFTECCSCLGVVLGLVCPTSKNVGNQTCMSTLGNFVLLYPQSKKLLHPGLCVWCCGLYLKICCTRWWWYENFKLLFELDWFMALGLEQEQLIHCTIRLWRASEWTECLLFSTRHNIYLNDSDIWKSAFCTCL